MGWFDHWRKQPEAKPEAQPSATAAGREAPDAELERLALQERVVVFKHSRSCPVSWRADAEVQQFSRLHPEVPVFKLVVQQQRELSRRIADWTGIEHASPQVIVLRRGVVTSSESHEGVTVEYLQQSTAMA